jgi:Domain of unknown function (DUF4190)
MADAMNTMADAMKQQAEEVTMSGPAHATRVAPPDAAPQTQRTSRMAIWSLVLSILTLGGLGSLAGIWLGFTARRRIAETGERGSGVAIASIVVGVVTLILAIAYWAYIVMHTGSAGGGGGYGY